MSPEAVEVVAFREWLAENGVYIHPHLRFVKDTYGMSIHATQTISADTKIVSCPFSLAITPGLAKDALTVILTDTAQGLDSLSERELICTYLVMHLILDETQDAKFLASTTDFRYLPYLRVLPPTDALRTALHFTAQEISLLKGTNLFGAAADRHTERNIEWKRCRTFVRSTRAEWEALFTWERYLTMSTYVSSRAFPSTILSRTPSLNTTPSSYPVLLPGLDSLNHSRARRVSWVVSGVEEETPSSTPIAITGDSSLHISLVVHTPTQANTEIFNNYGPKPNSELILGYGFSLPSNPDDTIVLKIGGHDGAAGALWEVGRKARGIEGLWEELKTILSGGADEADEWEIELDVADALKGMVESKIARLPELPTTAIEGVRSDVLYMIQNYILGQKDILQSIRSFADAKFECASIQAKSEGVEFG